MIDHAWRASTSPVGLSSSHRNAFCHEWSVFQCLIRVNHRSFGMNNIVWIVGAVVIVLAVLSFFGLR